MSNETNKAAQPPPPAAPASPSATFQSLKENFSTISSLAIVGGIGLATIFLYTYLSVFDWHLVWFVQYADILTFGLIAVGIIGGSLVFLQSWAQTFLDIVSLSGKSKWFWLVGSGLASVAIIAFNINDAVRQREGYFHILFGALVLALGLIVILATVSYVKDGRWPNAAQTAFAMVLIIFSTVCLGKWLGYSVLETSKFDQDVMLKGETLSGAKLVIVMSRHTILIKDKVLYVVPTADIAQFRTVREK